MMCCFSSLLKTEWAKSVHAGLELFGSVLWKKEPVPNYKEPAESKMVPKPAVTSAG